MSEEPTPYIVEGQEALVKARSHIRGIQRNHGLGAHTYGNCPTEGCVNSGRGSGLCAPCHTNELGKLVGIDRARNYTMAVISVALIEEEMLTLLKEKK
jgi:hypothetical protein